MDAKQEIATLRQYLGEAVTSTWATVEVKAKHQQSLDDLNAPLADESTLYFGTIDYGATGEGQTYKFFAAWARSRGQFLEKAAAHIGGYYVMGLNVYDRLPENDAISDFLLSARMRDWIIRENEMSGHQGNIVISLSHHVNYS